MPSCQVCGRRRPAGTGDLHRHAVELTGVGRGLKLLLEWDAALPADPPPGPRQGWAQLAAKCAQLGAHAHTAVHGAFEQRQAFLAEHVTSPGEVAAGLEARARDVELFLLRRATNLSPPTLHDRWWPRYAEVRPQLAVRFARSE